jgi:pyruvate kinase
MKFLEVPSIRTKEKIVKSRLKRTSIIATLGPSSNNEDTIYKMVQEGVNVFRLNFSHGTHAEHAELIRIIRKIEADIKQPIGILGDLSGPKIRIGNFENGQIFLKEGDSFQITVDLQVLGNQHIVSTTYEYLVRDLSPGDKILLDDGKLTLIAESKTHNAVNFKVMEGGILKDKKGMNMPGIRLSIDSITEKDKVDFKFILEHELDFTALSFVRSAECINELRSLASKINVHADIQIVAKIEKPEALSELDNIIDVSDVIMIARGDLGVELPIERVPAIQKDIIARCRAKGVPVITATQMLESMITNSRPTRAETTDVFNAIVDGTDAVMLSGETASGAHPVLSVKMMTAIAKEAEETLENNPPFTLAPKTGVKRSIANTVALTACQSAIDLKAKAIVALTKLGTTARRISHYHPPIPIVALSTSKKICRRMSLYYGVIVVAIPELYTTDEMFLECELAIRNFGLAKYGDIAIIVAGIPMGDEGSTNLIKIHQLK